MKLSKRLMTVASLIPEEHVLADVGTDHGYLPIYLLEQKKIPRAIAMDVNQGPLERAREHITRYGMGDYIETRLSDGVASLAPGEADTILIAGMGGSLMMHILEAGMPVCQNAEYLVLQPQSELERVRNFLARHEFVTVAEEMVEEEGKYYPMMRVQSGGRQKAATEDDNHLFALYGELLLKNHHPVLEEYLQKEHKIYQAIAGNLIKQPDSDSIRQRLWEVKTVLEQNERARGKFYGERHDYAAD